MRAFVLLSFILAGSLSFESAASAALKKKTRVARVTAGSPSVSEEAEEFTKRVSNMHRWKDLIRELEGVLPGNVVREISKAADEVDFPKIKPLKPGLLLSDPEGNKLKIRFDANGRVFFNEVEWKLRPLATAASEIQRIEEFLRNQAEGHASIFDVFLPRAVAGSAGAGGIALFGHSVSSGWAGESCGAAPFASLTKDQQETCPLMAVSMQDSSLDPEKYLQVGLNCPKNGNGTLEVIKMNKLGEISKGRTFFVSNQATRVQILGANKGESFRVLKDIDLSSEPDSEKLAGGEGIAKIASAFINKICNGDAQAKARFYASLAANKGKIQGSGSSETAALEDDNESQSGL